MNNHDLIAVGAVVWTGYNGFLSRHTLTSVTRERGCQSGINVTVTPALKKAVLSDKFDSNWFAESAAAAREDFAWNLKWPLTK